ncbi:MAG: outer membrane protein assembly factor BamE domain-containing protein [Candidatus Puniceispirillaceae bacterium]|jgi:outer membrane protein assembly factor BamE (lipoprotein component of BamABCDE complex)
MKNPATKLFSALICLGLFLGLQGCESQVTSHGNLIEASQLNKLEIGTTRREDVMILFGPASFEGAFNNNRLYYNNQKMEAPIAGRTQTIERELVVLSFDVNNILESIEIRDKSTDQEIVKLDAKTPTPGDTLTVVDQLFTNLRRR